MMAASRAVTVARSSVCSVSIAYQSTAANRIAMQTRNRPAITRVRRKVEVLNDLRRWANGITGATHGVDQLRGESFVDFAAQPAHMAFDHIRARIEVKIPDALKQHRSRHNLARVPHEVLQQQKFAGLQLDFSP